MQALTGADAILTACAHHPVARFAAGILASPTGLSHDGAILFAGRARGDGDTVFYLGPDDGLGPLLDAARAERLLDHLGWIHLPRGCPLPDGFEVRDNWDLLWTGQPPPPVAGPDAVPLSPADDAAIDALLDLAMPDTTVRPGHPLAHAWYGVRSGATVVACGADRSGHHLPAAAGGVGVLGGIAVHPDHRGRGCGTAVSAALTARLLDTYDLVTLGVWAANHTARRMYERLGYTGRAEITSIQPA